MNKIFKNIIIIFILLGFTYILNDNFKLNFNTNFNTNFNKYSNILENKIYKLNDLINKNNISDITLNTNSFYNINNTFIILIITICTSVIFFYIYLFNKPLLSGPFIILYMILILITLKILF